MPDTRGYRHIMRNLHKRAIELGYKIEPLPIVNPVMDFQSGVGTMHVRTGDIGPNTSRLMLYDGISHAICAAPSVAACGNALHIVAARYFKLFGEIPPVIPVEFEQEYAILAQVEFDRLPSDRDLLRRMSCAARMPGIGDVSVHGFHADREDLCRSAEFYATYGRFPLNEQEIDTGAPMRVKLSRFGMELPYMVPISLRDNTQNNVVVAQEGFYDSVTGRLVYSMPLRYDPVAKEFREEQFFSIPYRKSAEGIARIRARLEATEDVNTLASSLELVIGDSLSLRGFALLEKLFDKTYGSRWRPAHVAYDPLENMLRITMQGLSEERVLPVLDSITKMEGYLAIAVKIPCCAAERRLIARNGRQDKTAHKER